MITPAPKIRKVQTVSPLALWAAALALSPATLALAAVWTVGWWVDGADAPERSDVIVVAAGAYARAAYGGDLYALGYAQEVWVPQAQPDQSWVAAAQSGVKVPAESEVYREILVKKGVPPGKIRLYGEGVGSTLEEARAFARAFDARGRKVLVVTSRFHARRARMMFRRQLRGAEVRVAATPYEAFSRAWWRHKELAANSILEVFKTAKYLTGSFFGMFP